MTEQITIRQLSQSELAELMTWAKDEGWNPGLNDTNAFFAADPEGFLGCFVDDAFVSGISCVTYGDDFGFIGLYITRADMRGKGYGLHVWNAAMERLGDRIIGLDGVPEQQDNYAKMGFVTAYETVRWSGICQSDNHTGPSDTVGLDDDQLDAISAYDEGLFPAARKTFLEKWITPPRSAMAIREAGRLAGYAVSRGCHQGAKLGPLFADDDTKAQQLLSTAINICAGAELHIDVPTYKTEFSAFLSRLGFKPGFKTARMYKGGTPKNDMEKIFAITSLELG